jgi:hypothetical protein
MRTGDANFSFLTHVGTGLPIKSVALLTVPVKNATQQLHLILFKEFKDTKGKFLNGARSSAFSSPQLV